MLWRLRYMLPQAWRVLAERFGARGQQLIDVAETLDAGLSGSLARVFGRDGICTDSKLPPDEMDEVRRIVRESWLGVIEKVAPEHVERFRRIGITNYHQFSHLIDHANIWTTQRRTFERQHVDAIRSFKIFDMFDRDIPGYEISSEMPPFGDLGRPRVNWRLVRPGSAGDLGPIHADYWFDAVQDNWRNERRPTVKLKIWIPIYLEEGITGFAFVPGSHLRDYPFRRLHIGNGAFKPDLPQAELDRPLRTLTTPPGTAVMFNYNLVHRGANSSHATRTRVSMELALNIPRGLLEERCGDVSRYH